MRARVLEMKRQLSPRKLCAAMKARGWNEKDLSYHSDLSLPTVQALLDGSSSGNTTSFLRLADALQVEDLNTLFDQLD